MCRRSSAKDSAWSHSSRVNPGEHPCSLELELNDRTHHRVVVDAVFHEPYTRGVGKLFASVTK